MLRTLSAAGAGGQFDELCCFDLSTCVKAVLVATRPTLAIVLIVVMIMIRQYQANSTQLYERGSPWPLFWGIEESILVEKMSNLAIKVTMVMMVITYLHPDKIPTTIQSKVLTSESVKHGNSCSSLQENGH